MVVLQNDRYTAQECATSLSNGLSSLTSSGAVTKDSETKLGGNTKAQEVIDKSHELSVQVGQVLVSMAQHIQSVSSSFQAMDAELGSQLKNTGFSINGPR